MNTDFTDLALQTIISQYGASPHIKALVENIGKHISPTADINLFYTKIFNVSTAEGVGLDIWGRIVGAVRNLYVTQGHNYFGYDGSNLDPWNISPFYYSDTAIDTFRMNDIAYRKMIMYKALANISDCTLPAIKTLMRMLFEDKVFKVELNGVMSIKITFGFYLSDYENAVLQAYGVLNRGAGVGLATQEDPNFGQFGFSGSGQQPFDIGVFKIS